MKKIMLFVAATFVMAAIGCSKDDVATDDVQYVSELKVNFEGDTRVNVAHSAAGLKFAWEDGDVIEVFEDKNTEALYKMFEYDASSASFKPQSESDKLIVGTKYFAVTHSTGYFISISDDKSVVSMDLKGGTGVSNIPMISDVFIATTENTMATMHHIVGVIEIPVKTNTVGAKLQTVGLNSQTANVSLRGEFSVSPVAPYTLTPTYGYFNNYNQTDTDTPIDISTTEAKSMFVPAFPGTYSTIDVKYTLVGNEEKTINTNHSLVVERGKITKISEQVLE